MYFHDVDKVVLTSRESALLRRIARANGKLVVSEADAKILCKYKLVERAIISRKYLSDQGGLMEITYGNTYTITDAGIRYRVLQKRDFINTRFPIIVSAVALIKSFDQEILSLIQSIVKLLKSITLH